MRTSSLLLLLPSALLAQSIIFQHATIIDGTGRLRHEASLEIRDDRIVGVNLPLSRGSGTIDCHGMTIIPGIINAHGHLGVVRGTTTSPDNFTRDNIAAELDQYAHYGVTAMLSLGLNHDLIYDLRAEQRKGEFAPQGAAIYTAGRGIGVPGGAPALNVGDNQVYRPATAAEARADVREMAAHNPDIVKIWVDDVGGTKPKMQPEIYQAVIEEAHANHLRVAAHVYYLADAAALVDLAVDVLAHSIRDREVDPALVRKMKEKGVYYVPTLELDNSFYHYADHPDLLNDPFLAEALNPDLKAMLSSREWRDKVRNDPATAKERQAFAIALRNLKAMYTGGVKIAMGTDSGATPLRVPGYAEHLEMELMRRAGMSAMDILTSATSGSAEVCGAKDRGTLEAGKVADFMVLEEDPLEDIRNTRKIFQIWHNGLMVPVKRTNP